MKIIAYTDGSCLGNGRKDLESHMACGVRLVFEDGTKQDKALYYGTGTNQRAEILAISLALEEIQACLVNGQLGYLSSSNVTVEIRTDSQYAIGCLSNPKWNPKVNLDLISEAKGLMTCFKSVTYTWVKGHANSKDNNDVDRLAVAAQLERLTTTVTPTVVEHEELVVDRVYSFLFSCGNSNEGTIGFCARVRATTKQEARKLLEENMPEHTEVLYEVGPIESLDVYFNAKNIKLKDIEDEEEITYEPT